MSLALDFSSWATTVVDWIATINTSTHGAIDILIAFLISSAALYVLYNYLQKAQT